MRGINKFFVSTAGVALCIFSATAVNAATATLVKC